MKDLLIAINISASRKNHCMVIDTYLSDIRINKYGKYLGGHLATIDINDFLTVKNCNYHEVLKIFRTFCRLLYKNSYQIEVEDFVKNFEFLVSKDIIFIDNLDKSLYVVKSISNNKITGKSKFYYETENIDFIYNNDNSLCIVTKNNNLSYKEINPIPHLIYGKEDSIYELYFDYVGEVVFFSEKRLSIEKDNVTYFRNNKFEQEIFDFLIKVGFVKLAQSKLIYSGRNNITDLFSLLNKKQVFIDNNENIVVPKIRVNRSSSGWFDIDLICEINGQVIDLASQINLLTTRNSISVDDKNIILPDSILQAKDNIELENNKLRINQKNIFALLRIVYDSDKIIDNLFSYSDIKINLPNKIKKIAFSYQLDGIKWLKFLFVNNFGGCLADDMGLGKTFQVIAFLEELEVKKHINKVLVIVPKSLLTNWKKEFEKFNSSYSVLVYHGDKRENLKIEKYDAIITTYNTALLDNERLSKIEYSAVIFDEIQIIKNYKSITSNAMKKINSKFRIGLSGTPMENGISELWNVMDVLNPGVFLSHEHFVSRYKGKNYSELKSILNLFILRRVKENVLNQLPPKFEQVIYCDMEEEQKNLYTSINVAVKQMIMNLGAFSAPIILKGLLRLRQCCCHPLLLDQSTNPNNISSSCKIETLKLLIDDLIESNHKILIFSQFTSMLEIIKKELEKYSDILFYLDGQTKERSEVVNKFETSAKGIFLISIKAGGVGLNLVSAQDVVIFDPWWNPFVEEQAIDRAYRIGQNKTVNVYKLVTANTLEEKIIEMQKNKQEDFDALINGISTDKNIDLKKVLHLL